MKKFICIIAAGAVVLLAAGPACAWQTLIASGITASSTLEGGNYVPQNAQDFITETAWIEGVPGNGVGECLYYEIDEGAEIDAVTVFPGYQKTEDLLFANGAPVHLNFMTNDVNYEVWMTPAANTFYGQAGSGYTYVFEEPLISDGMVIVEIMGVRPGTRYEDTCISELRFLGAYDEDFDGDDVGYQDGSYDNYQSGYDDGYDDGFDDYGYDEPFTDDPFYSFDEISISSSQAGLLSSFAFHLCSKYQEEDDLYPDDIVSWDLTDEEQAFMLYWYQYNVEDSRIDYIPGTGYNYAYDRDMQSILYELFGEQTDEYAFDTFLDEYVEDIQGNLLYMSGTGDFGDAGACYFESPDEVWMEGNMIGLSGRVMRWNSNAGSYLHNNQYTAYFTANPKQSEYDTQTFCFNEVQIGDSGQY